MRELRFARAWRFGGFALLALALVALLVPGAGAVLPPGSSDKIVHAIGFFGMTTWFAGVYRRARWGRVALGMLAFGVLTEVLQGLATRTRSADPVDFVADAVGVGIAMLAARAGLEHWARIAERLLVRV